MKGSNDKKRLFKRSDNVATTAKFLWKCMKIYATIKSALY